MTTKILLQIIRDLRAGKGVSCPATIVSDAPGLTTYTRPVMVVYHDHVNDLPDDADRFGVVRHQWSVGEDGAILDDGMVYNGIEEGEPDDRHPIASMSVKAIRAMITKDMAQDPTLYASMADLSAEDAVVDCALRDISALLQSGQGEEVRIEDLVIHGAPRS